MGLLTSPLYLLGPPLLLVVSIPLTIFACVTTTVAVSLLAIRVSAVYIDLALTLLRVYLFPEPPTPVPKRPPPPHESPRPPRSFRRTSISSQDTAVPAARIHTKSGSSVSLINANEMISMRDYEGVGGWRLYEDEQEEALWMGMNSRLELPLATTPKRHQRRHTGEVQLRSWSPEALRMSPVQSRSRTPTQTHGHDREGDEYFPPQLALRPLSTASEPLNRSAHHSRRTSASGSSSSSISSIPTSRRTSTVFEQTDE